MKRPAVWLALALLLLTAALLTYRIVWLGYPVFPTAPGRTWQLLIDAHIKGGSGETTLALAVPSGQAGLMLVEEKVTSGALHFNLLREGPNRIGVWSGEIGPGEEEINYRATILIRPGRHSEVDPPALGKFPLDLEKEEQALAERLTKNWSRIAPIARIKAVAAATAGEWGEPLPEPRDTQAWKILQEKYGALVASLILLEASGLPARTVEGFRLFEGVKTKPLTWIEVWTGQRWQSLKPETGEIEKIPPYCFHWLGVDFPQFAYPGARFRKSGGS